MARRLPVKSQRASQGSWAHLNAELSNAAQMASNILLKVITHFNVGAAWPDDGCCSASFQPFLHSKKLPCAPPALYSRPGVRSSQAPVSPSNRTKESRFPSRRFWTLSAHYRLSRNHNAYMYRPLLEFHNGSFRNNSWKLFFVRTLREFFLSFIGLRRFLLARRKKIPRCQYWFLWKYVPL